jgi:hypothetical protein
MRRFFGLILALSYCTSCTTEKDFSLDGQWTAKFYSLKTTVDSVRVTEGNELAKEIATKNPTSKEEWIVLKDSILFTFNNSILKVSYDKDSTSEWRYSFNKESLRLQLFKNKRQPNEAIGMTMCNVTILKRDSILLDPWVIILGGGDVVYQLSRSN